MTVADSGVKAQILKNARELAQAETARALRAGKFVDAEGVFDPAGVHAFEMKRREMHANSQRQAHATGKLPAGIRQVAALPSINDLKLNQAPPVI